MDTKKTNKQHFVSQFYLKHWAKPDEMLSVKGSGKPFESNSKNIGHENHLYRIEGLGKKERDLLLNGLQKVPEPMHSLFKTMITVCYYFKVFSALPTDMDTTNKIELQKQNIVENFYSAFEDQVNPSFMTLVNGEYEKFDINYYQDILRFVVLQLTRTPKVKEISRQMMQEEFIQRGLQFRDFDTLHSAIIAEQITTALIERLYQIEIIENTTDLNFITSDNPVKNLLPIKDKLIELFWPINPRKALIIKPTNFSAERATEIKDGIVNHGKKADYLITITKKNELLEIQKLNQITWHNKHRHIYYLNELDIIGLE